MMYVRCVKNNAYVKHRGQPLPDDMMDISLTVGKVYKALPPTEDERRLGEIRVIDNEGEDYLYPVSYFELVSLQNGLSTDLAASITVHIDELTKDVLHAEAVAAQKSVSALVRDWIDEHLDLPAN